MLHVLWATLASLLRWFWPNLEFCYKKGTPGSDDTKGGLSNGNVVEVDLEKKSQRAHPILTRMSHPGLWDPGRVWDSNQVIL